MNQTSRWVRGGTLAVTPLVDTWTNTTGKTGFTTTCFDSSKEQHSVNTRQGLPSHIPPGQQWPGTPIVHHKHGSHQSRPQVTAQASFLAQLVFRSLEESDGDGAAICDISGCSFSSSRYQKPFSITPLTFGLNCTLTPRERICCLCTQFLHDNTAVLSNSLMDLYVCQEPA